MTPASLISRLTSPMMPRWPAALAAACVLAALSTITSQATAADKTGPAKRSENKPFVPKPIEPLLTRDELRACMTLRSRNQEQGAEATRMQAEVLAEMQASKREGEALKADLATIDRSNAEAVAAYNQRVAQRAGRVAEFEAKVADFNAKVAAVEAGQASYARDCQNRKFDEEDEKALLKGS